MTEARKKGTPGRAHAGSDEVRFVDEVRRHADSMLQVGRELTGTGGVFDRAPLRTVLRRSGARIYPLIAIVALTSTQLLYGVAWGIMQPDVGKSFGLNPLFFTVLNLFGTVIAFVVPIAVARYVQNRARRAQVMLAAAALFCVITPLTGLALAPAALIAAAIADQVTTYASGTVSAALVMDLYPPQARVRAIATLTVSTMIAGVAGNGLVLLLTSVFDLTWRGVFVAVGVIGLFGLLIAFRLRDPGYGRYDTERLRAATRGEHVDVTAPAPIERRATGTRLSLFEAMRKIWSIRTMRMTLIASMIATLAGPVNVYLMFFYTERFALDASERALLSGLSSATAIIAYLLLAPWGDRIYQRDPARLFVIAGIFSIVGTVLYGLQVYSPNVVVLFVVTIAASATTGMLGPAMTVGSLSLVPAALRPHVGAVTGLFIVGGTAIATVLLAGVATTMGLANAVIVSSAIAIVGTIIGMLAGRSMRSDLDAMLEEVIEGEAVDQLRDQGVRIPLLAVRGVEFAYGQTQVLFGVDFHVDHGEIVALLGVNGAGKSTLLRVISGLGLPSRGSIRLDGADITFLDADRRAVRGITQVPGGRAVFGDLTVLENLRCYGFQLKGRRELNARIEEALDAFPRLRERQASLAAQLSGGEQQMLALAKAYIMRPKLLVIDELSLGLAPIIVDQLLAMVRRINEQGVAVVLVEQSVNIALAVSDRACFMEHGQVRFDGPSHELLEHDELLRAVFLSGAAAVTE